MSAPRYPFELVESHRLKGGRLVLVRPIHPQDETLVQSFVRGLSPRSRYFRFHNAIRELDPRMLHAATHVDYRRHLALIANGSTATPKSRSARRATSCARTAAPRSSRSRSPTRGSARPRAPSAREADGHRERRGIAHFEGDVLEENQAMVGLALDLGFEVREHSSEPGVLVVARELVQDKQRPALPASGTRRLPLPML
jgi:acetyltransferase